MPAPGPMGSQALPPPSRPQPQHTPTPTSTPARLVPVQAGGRAGDVEKHADGTGLSAEQRRLVLGQRRVCQEIAGRAHWEGRHRTLRPGHVVAGVRVWVQGLPCVGRGWVGERAIGLGADGSVSMRGVSSPLAWPAARRRAMCRPPRRHALACLLPPFPRSVRQPTARADSKHPAPQRPEQSNSGGGT